jgi:hypothetical protein
MERNVNPTTIQEARGFDRVKLVEDAVAAFVVNDDTRRGYLSRAGYVDRLFKSLLPDTAANEFGPICKVFRVIAEKIRSEIPPVDIAVGPRGIKRGQVGVKIFRNWQKCQHSQFFMCSEMKLVAFAQSSGSPSIPQ